MTSYDQSAVRPLTCFTISLADRRGPDTNSRLMRRLLSMTFTWVPPTSTAKMALRDCRFAGAPVADGFFIDGYLSRRCDRRVPMELPQRNAAAAVRLPCR